MCSSRWFLPPPSPPPPPFPVHPSLPSMSQVLTSGEGGAPGTMGGKAKAKTGTTGYGDSDSHLASPGTSDTDSMSASLLSLTSQTTEQSDADVQAAAATAAQGEGTAGAAADGSVVNDREGARTWWRCDAEERRIAKAAPGMSGRCEWKVGPWQGREGVAGGGGTVPRRYMWNHDFSVAETLNRVLSSRNRRF